ncbi:MAG: AAA family ATPase [Burkholderiaceae bacterium]|nr:AAA family ATPase [Burkholderiaceae bacterium]
MAADSNPALAQAQALVDALQARPTDWHLPGMGTVASPAERLETHISWLLLAGERVLKFKKPLNLGFLDFTTLAQRREACEAELRLNRRTAPALYLGLVAVLGTPEAPRLVMAEDLPAETANTAHPPQTAEAGATGVLEWAVLLRRFAPDALLAEQAARGTLTPAHIDALAAQVAALHAQAEPLTPAHAEAPWGTAAAMHAAVADNFATLAPFVQGTAHAAPCEALRAWSEAQGQRLAGLMDQRRAQGWVREGHGDLHLGNLVLLDGQPRLFDAIEFNAAFRWTDTVFDMAFLVMDLQVRGQSALAARFLDAYLAHTGDYAGLALLPYALAYRAMVRAKVAALQAMQQPPEAQAPLRAELARYLDYAMGLLQPRPPVLWLATGVSGSGKSSQSQGLIEAQGIVRTKADVERKRLFGLDPLSRSAAQTPVQGGIYTPEATARTYERLEDLARTVLQAGCAVLVDATCLQRSQRARFQALAEAVGVPFRLLAFEAPVEVLRARIVQRAAQGQDPSEADLAVLDAQRAQREPLAPGEQAQALAVDTTAPVDWAQVLPAGWR